ncbi:hypothetical protein B4U80_14961, partial [Leptotrombidium deliense]
MNIRIILKVFLPLVLQFNVVNGLKYSKFNFPLLAHYAAAKSDLKPFPHSRIRKQRNFKININDLKVGIVGAGISGLYTALLLQELGIDYEILEASERIG